MFLQTRPRLRKLLLVWGASFAVFLPWWMIYFFLEIDALNGSEDSFGEFFFILLNLPLILGFASLALVCLPAAIFSKKENRYSPLIALSVALIYFLSLFIWGKAAGAYQESMFHRAALQAQPLVEAIERFHLERGSPPADLRELVPDYLPAIPETGAGGKTEFKYFVRDPSRHSKIDFDWELSMDLFIPDPFIVNRIIYHPNHEYNDYGSEEYIDDWFHEHFAM